MKPNVVHALAKLGRLHYSHGKHNLVAAVVYKSNIICTGYNSYVKTHPLQLRVTGHPAKIYLHAEIDAVDKALKFIGEDDLRRCDLYVIRIKKDGTYGCSKPCENCQRYVESKVRRIYHH